MNYEIVNLHTGGQAQRWLLVYPDGRIMLRTAREAITSLGYGADPLSTPVTIEGIRKTRPARRN